MRLKRKFATYYKILNTRGIIEIIVSVSIPRQDHRGREATVKETVLKM